MRRVLRRRGFTVVEMMVVVMVIAVLMAILVPNFMAARNSAARKSCMSNLRLIDQAKEQLSMESRKNDGDAVDWGDLVPHYMRAQPTCPLGPAYTPKPIGVKVTCSIVGHELP